MRYLNILAFLLIGVIAKANHENDTIPYWHISYGNTVIIRGNIIAPQDQKHELTVKPDAVKALTISFIYDDSQPKSSLLTVKEKNEVLRKFEQDPVMGPYFVVPVREMIGTHQPNVQYELDFFYTDDHQKNLKLGTIIFILK